MTTWEGYSNITPEPTKRKKEKEKIGIKLANDKRKNMFD